MEMQSNFRIFCSDAVTAMKTMPDQSVDLIFADPPYFLSNGGISVKSGKMVSVNKGKWDQSSGFEADQKFHESWILESLRILKNDGSIFISGTYHSIFLCGYLLQANGCRIVNDIVWFKPNGAPALAGRNFTASHETLIWATKSNKAKHFFNYSLSKNWAEPSDKLLNSGKQMRSVWSIPTTPKREKLLGQHPTQKPVALLERIISICTQPGDLVLDPFCGSGTTGVVSVVNNRKFIGIDLDQGYTELSERRILKAYEESQLIEKPWN